jgi:hypothetical protein
MSRGEHRPTVVWCSSAQRVPFARVGSASDGGWPEGRAGPHPVGVMRASEGGCTMASGTGMRGRPGSGPTVRVSPKEENVYGRGR